MRCLIIGASSGIGKALAEVFARRGWEVILTARRTHLLDEIKSRLAGAQVETHFMDITNTGEAVALIDKLFVPGLDMVILNAGINYWDPASPAAAEAETIQTNVFAFAAIARTVLLHFIKTGRGHLAGVSSVAGVRGSPQNPAYSASKAFVSNYLQGLRGQIPAGCREVLVTDIIPGFVETPMISRRRDFFWVASAEKAAEQIYRGLKKKKTNIYITRRWILLAAVYKIIPESLFFGVFRKTHCSD